MIAPVSRRYVLKAVGALAATGFLGACLSRPQYYYSKGESGFQGHIDNTERFAYGGSDYDFGDGMPLWSPVKGLVTTSQRFSGSGNTIDVDYGIISLGMGHQKRLFSRVNDAVDRTTILGRQGSTGDRSIGHSHVHVTVFGNAILHDHNYLKPNSTIGRYGPGGKKPGVPYHWNFVLDPDALTPDRKTPLHLAYYDPGIDYDTPYLDFVETRIKPGLQEIAKRWSAKEGLGLRMDVENDPLYKTINDLWVFSQTGLKELNRRGKGKKLRAAIEDVFDDVKAAGRLIKLTSPYLDPGNRQTILHMIRENPGHNELIHKYYDRFLKAA